MKAEETEIWKAIPFDERYMISNLGNMRNINGTIRKFNKTKDGYFTTNLVFDGKLMTFTVHRLVLLTFVRGRLEGETINHRDGNKENNRVSNLEYVTHLENMQHAFSTGLVHTISSIGESNVKAKLTEKDVKLIRYLYSTNEYYQKELARQFGVDQTQISQIVRGKSWKHIPLLQS